MSTRIHTCCAGVSPNMGEAQSLLTRRTLFHVVPWLLMVVFGLDVMSSPFHRHQHVADAFGVVNATAARTDHRSHALLAATAHVHANDHADIHHPEDDDAPGSMHSALGLRQSNAAAGPDALLPLTERGAIYSAGVTNAAPAVLPVVALDAGRARTGRHTPSSVHRSLPPDGRAPPVFAG